MRAAEAFSAKAAETLTLDELRPYWRGLFQEKVFFTYDRCGACGLLYAPVFFDQTQLGELYSAMAPNMDAVPTDAIEATQRVYFEEATAGLTVSGNFLEIGPDVGLYRRPCRERPAVRAFLFVRAQQGGPRRARGRGERSSVHDFRGYG